MSSTTSLLALDIGERHVGVAVATGEPLIPVRHSVIDRVSQDFTARVAALVAKESITTVVVGLPRNLDGEETPQTVAVRADMVLLRSALSEHVKITTMDETLTSVEARSRLRQAGESLEHEHAEAAKIILEDCLRTWDNTAEHLE